MLNTISYQIYFSHRLILEIWHCSSIQERIKFSISFQLHVKGSRHFTYKGQTWSRPRRRKLERSWRFISEMSCFKLDRTADYTDSPNLQTNVATFPSIRQHHFKLFSIQLLITIQKWVTIVWNTDRVVNSITNKMELQHYTPFDPTNCTTLNKWAFVTYVPPTYFDLYKPFIREVHAKTYKYSRAAIVQSV